jgi:hypothetical protein
MMGEKYMLAERVKAFWGYRCSRAILPAMTILNSILLPTAEEKERNYSKITYQDCLTAIHEARLKKENERAKRPSLMTDLSQFIRDVSGR